MILKKQLYRLLCFISLFTFSLSAMTTDVCADDYNGDKPSLFAYTLNDAMVNFGVLSTDELGGYKDIDFDSGIFPTGVIYADIIDFDDNESPYLVIFRSDSTRGCASALMYRYDEHKREASLVNIISKGYNLPEGVCGEMTIGYNDTKRYIIYNEYTEGVKTKSEYYTAIDGEGYSYLTPPAAVEETGVLSFNCHMLHPEVDVSGGNHYLSDFFSKLKNMAADSVSYPDISDAAREEEIIKIEKVLKTAAKHRHFDIGQYSDIPGYKAALADTDADNTFYSITNLYDIGQQLYYVRFATDQSFYNFALLRRTNAISEEYQIVAVRCDAIPFSDLELANAKETYTHNKLLYRRARGSITEMAGSFKLFDIKPVIPMPKVIGQDCRRSIGLIGGGMCILLFAFLWIHMGSDPEDI